MCFIHAGTVIFICFSVFMSFYVKIQKLFV